MEQKKLLTNSKEKVYIPIHYLPGAPELEMIEKGDWIDLYCYEDIDLKAGQFAYISQGVSMVLPQGYEAIVAPRSSTFKRYGLLMTNSIGIIDNSYCGTGDIWCFPALATKDVHIDKGTRICQFRIQENQPAISFIPMLSLGTANRGGLGSTGV